MERAGLYKYPRCCHQKMNRTFIDVCINGKKKRVPTGWTCRVCKRFKPDREGKK